LNFLLSPVKAIMDTNVLLIGGGVLVLLIILFIASGNSKCSCSEAYGSKPTAEFSVKRPKYIVEQTHPVKRPMNKEGFIIPTPSKAQTLKSANLGGGTIGSTSNPFMGGLKGAASYGVSVPPSNTATLVSGNGQGNPEVEAVWKTVI
jgi:hypothetical protein